MQARSKFTGMLLLVVALAGMGLGQQYSAPAQGPALANPSEEGITVLGRGLVHEAFAGPLTVHAQPSPIIPKEPPTPVEELPPDQKPVGNHVQWIPGYWAWDDDSNDYIWVSGLWRDVPPGRQWVPGYWNRVEGGVQWVAGYWIESGQAEVQYLPPPPASLEAGPSGTAPGVDYVYIPGCWVYHQTRYVWRPGFWNRYYNGWFWTPARYGWTPSGYVFVDGYWDYAFHRRGLLFAPVRLAANLLGRTNWYYRPRYIVPEAALVSALFVRGQFGNYYFGNYYDARFTQRGFVPWMDYRIGQAGPDPFYAQYRFQYREPERWDNHLRTLNSERRNNEAARPPSTLEQQNTLIQQNKSANTLAILAPLNQVNQKTFNLKPVTAAAMAEETKLVQQNRQVREQRQKTEASLRAEGTVPTQPTDPPRAAKLTLPKSGAASPAKELKLPPAPKTPQPEARPIPKAEPKVPAVVPTPSPKTEPKPAPKPEPKTDPKPNPKAEPKPAPKAEPKPTPPPAPKAEPKPSPSPVPKAVPKSTPPPAPKAEPKPSPPPAPKVVPKSTPPPAPKVVPKPPPQKVPAPSPAPRPKEKGNNKGD